MTNLRSSETVHTIGADLERKLTTIEHGANKWVRRLLQLLLRLLSRSNEFFKNDRQDALLYMRLDKVVAVRRPRHLVAHLLSLEPVRYIRSIAKVVRHHNRRIQGCKIERRDRLVVVALLWVDDDGALKLVTRALTAAHGNDEVHALSFTVQLTSDLDLLSAREQERNGNACDSRHLGQVEQTHELVEQAERQVSILHAVDG